MITRCAFLYTRRHLQALADADLSLAWSPCGITLHLVRAIATHEETQRRVSTTLHSPWPTTCACRPRVTLAGLLMLVVSAAPARWRYCRANLLPFRDLLTLLGRRRLDSSLRRRERVDAAGKTIADARHSSSLTRCAVWRSLAGGTLARGQVCTCRVECPARRRNRGLPAGQVTPEIDGERYAMPYRSRCATTPPRRLIHRENLA